MVLSPLEKIALQKQARTLLSELKGGTLSPFEKLQRQKEWRQIMTRLKGNVGAPAAPDASPDNTEADAGNPLFEKYLAGGFNATPATEFKEVVVQVHDEGLPFDDVRQGVVNWFEANPKIAA